MTGERIGIVSPRAVARWPTCVSYMAFRVSSVHTPAPPIDSVSYRWPAGLSIQVFRCPVPPIRVNHGQYGSG
jgi:hypothetical protein